MCNCSNITQVQLQSDFENWNPIRSLQFLQIADLIYDSGTLREPWKAVDLIRVKSVWAIGDAVNDIRPKSLRWFRKIDSFVSSFKTLEYGNARHKRYFCWYFNNKYHV